MKRRWIDLGCVLFGAWCVLIAGAVRADAVASLDRDQVAASDTVELRIRIDATLTDAEPELAPLNADFDVQGSSRNTQISIVNGRHTAFTEWRVTLAPRRTGLLIVPALSIGAQRTAPLTLRVTKAPPGDQATPDQVVKLELELDQQQVHVQSQLILTVRVLHAINLDRGASLGEPDIEHAVVKPLGENSFTRTIGGRQYGVFERRYAIFPQQRGELVIPPLRFESTVGSSLMDWFDQFNARTRTIRLSTEERRIAVLPPEPGASPWLPARTLSVVETWDKNPQELHVGDSATRTLTITAQGLASSQLPPLPVPAIAGMRFYPDQPKLSDEAAASGITGIRVESSAIIPERAGDIEFPELQLRWWDTTAQRFDTAVVPAKTIHILPAAGGTGITASPVPQSSPDAAAVPTPEITPLMPASGTPAPPLPWMIASLMLGLLALISSLQWWRLAHRSSAIPPSAAAAHAASLTEQDTFKQLRSACQHTDAKRASALLPAWMNQRYPRGSFRSLADVAARADDPPLRQQANALLQLLYGNADTSSAWNGAGLLECVNRMRAKTRGQATLDNEAALPPLYGAR